MYENYIGCLYWTSISPFPSKSPSVASHLWWKTTIWVRVRSSVISWVRVWKPQPSRTLAITAALATDQVVDTCYSASQRVNLSPSPSLILWISNWSAGGGKALHLPWSLLPDIKHSAELATLSWAAQVDLQYLIKQLENCQLPPLFAS